MTSFFGSVGNSVLKRIGRVAGRFQEQRPLESDLLESEDTYLIIFDAPGTTASDVDVRYEHDTVRVHIDRFREFYEDYEMLFPGRGLTISGSAKLPNDADINPQEAKAVLRKDGTLHVRLPKVNGSAKGGDSDDETK
ncbi:MAG: Hsp20/alpha crystallin family protein [Halobacteriaceae archaeon]